MRLAHAGVCLTAREKSYYTLSVFSAFTLGLALPLPPAASLWTSLRSALARKQAPTRLTGSPCDSTLMTAAPLVAPLQVPRPREGPQRGPPRAVAAERAPSLWLYSLRCRWPCCYKACKGARAYTTAMNELLYSPVDNFSCRAYVPKRVNKDARTRAIQILTRSTARRHDACVWHQLPVHTWSLF